MAHPIHIATDTKGVGTYARKTVVSDRVYRPILIIFPWAKSIVVNRDYGYSVRVEPKSYFGEAGEVDMNERDLREQHPNWTEDVINHTLSAIGKLERTKREVLYEIKCGGCGEEMGTHEWTGEGFECRK